VLSLRNFSRLDEAEFKQVNLHEGIDSTLMILQNRLNVIALTKTYAELPQIECYAGQLNQVFMNILMNGIDALEEITTKDDSFIAQLQITTEQVDTGWVKIAISNNGPCIPEDLQSKLFDPFFTTKPVGKGTGLGLSISYQIITEQHNGKLTCTSAPDLTTFEITLPVEQSYSIQSLNLSI
jgi:two-component system, NtrC family, sensor kinase